MAEIFRLKTGIPSVSTEAQASGLTPVPAKDIQKELYVFLDRYATTGVFETSFVLNILQKRVNIFDGFIKSVRPGQTINITIELDVLGEFIADICQDITYDEEEFAMISVSGGGAYRIKLKNCLPCNGDSCGTDAYDVQTVTRRTLKSNRAFAKALDYAMLTGKDIKTGLAIPGFKGLLDGAKTATTAELGTNSVDDLEKALVNLQEKVDNAELDYLTGATGTAGQAGYKANLTNNVIPRNLENDFVILASHNGVRKLRQHVDVPFSWLPTPTIVGGAYGTKYRGDWDSNYPLYEVPAKLIGGNDFVILDLATYVASVFCVNERYYDKGYDVKNPETAYYYKSWQYFATRIADAGNYSVIIPARADDKQVYLYKTSAGTVTQ